MYATVMDAKNYFDLPKLRGVPLISRVPSILILHIHFKRVQFCNKYSYVRSMFVSWWLYRPESLWGKTGSCSNLDVYKRK